MRRALRAQLLCGFLSTVIAGLPLFAAPMTVALPLGQWCRTSTSARFRRLESGFIQGERGLFSYYLRGESPLQPVVAVPDSATPGSAFAVYVAAGDLDRMGVEIRGTDGAVMMSNPGVVAAPGPAGGIQGWVSYCVLPSTYAAASCTLMVWGASGDRRFEDFSLLALREVIFAQMTIPLDAGLSALRRKDDERTRAERERLRLVVRSGETAWAWEPMIVPVDGGVESAGFGDRREYRYSDGTRAWAVHGGVDIAADTGTPVFACARGEVVLAAELLLSGNTVVVNHLPGVCSVYYHLDRISVAEGSAVEAGQVLGEVGSSGLATGPHLHWEVRVGGVASDPSAFVCSPLIDRAGVDGVLSAYEAQR